MLTGGGGGGSHDVDFSKDSLEEWQLVNSLQLFCLCVYVCMYVCMYVCERESVCMCMCACV
jgi:hypothetical protein